MEQFRHIGEVLGSMRALMVLQDDIQFNQRQCCLLLDIFGLAFNTIAEHIKQNLKLEEKNTKWKVLEQPMRELHRVFKEGESYVRSCLDVKDWWAKAIELHQNKDCVEFHVHNLLCHFPPVIEAIESAGEISGLDLEEMQKRRLVLARKYDKEWNDPKLFQWRYGKEYLVPHDICKRLENAWREDRWLLKRAIMEKKSLESMVLTKNDHQLADVLLKKLSAKEPSESGFGELLFPSCILQGGRNYLVRRRLGGGYQYKEIHWLGESFAMRHFFADTTESLHSEISTLLSLCHPNIVQYLCGFWEEERKEYFMVAELMDKDMFTFMRENSSLRRRFLFPLPVVVDLMLQIARGMEYLHSRNIYHGDLQPSNILLKPRNSSEDYMHAKVMGFGLSSVKRPSSRCSTNQSASSVSIWHAPEVLAEQEKVGGGETPSGKYTEKADVYSFGMICFQLLTGKPPFEDGHLQGEKNFQNIRTGERPLFPHGTPKYLMSLTKKCWQAEATQRPCFSSICRVLRYVKKFLVSNPDRGQPQLQQPPVDFCELDAAFRRRFSGDKVCSAAPVWDIPFQIFSFGLAEKDRSSLGISEKNAESGSDAVSISICRDESPSAVDDPPRVSPSETRSVCSAAQLVSDTRSICSEAPLKKMVTLRKTTSLDSKSKKAPGLPKPHSPKPSPLNPCGRSLTNGRVSQLTRAMSARR